METALGNFWAVFWNTELFFLIGMLSMSDIFIYYLSFLTCEWANKKIGINGMLITYNIEIYVTN